MADAAIFVGWGQPVRGREMKGLQVFNDALAYYARLQQAGTIESFEPVLLTVHGGDLAGFVLLRGEANNLNTLKQTDEFQKITLRAGQIVDGLGVIDAAIGASLATGMANYAAAITELA
ncbi:MAG: hypothetical protein ABI782_10465 [Anaerolineaceae bacterium]